MELKQIIQKLSIKIILFYFYSSRFSSSNSPRTNHCLYQTLPILEIIPLLF